MRSTLSAVALAFENGEQGDALQSSQNRLYGVFGSAALTLVVERWPVQFPVAEAAQIPDRRAFESDTYGVSFVESTMSAASMSRLTKAAVHHLLSPTDIDQHNAKIKK